MYSESNAAVENSPRTELAARPTPAVVARLLPANGPVVVPGTWYVACKRVLDVGAALVLLVLTAPVMAIACLLVKLTSRGPMLYSQTRVGRGGRPFTIWKIRSMYHNCEATSGAIWSRRGDPRVLPIGRFLRRTHIDELPQLWNLLKGEMSLIGPR